MPESPEADCSETSLESREHEVTPDVVTDQADLESNQVDSIHSTLMQSSASPDMEGDQRDSVFS